MMSRQVHWESLYSKDENEVSWFRENPAAPSLDLIAKVCATPERPGPRATVRRTAP